MMADGFGFAASTDLVFEENTSLSEQEIKVKMEDYLGITQYDVTLDPLADYIKHIDCWGKYLAQDKILIGRVPLNDDRYADYEAVADYFENTNCAYGYPYNVYRVFTPGTAPNTPYTNSIILNNKVLVPLTGSQWDDEAIAVYEEAMPGYEIIGMNWTEWFNTDALHCRAIGIADLDMLFLDHRPLFGVVDWQDSLAVEVKITPYSDEILVSDSLLVNYQVNNGTYMSAILHHSEGSEYVGYIKNYQASDTIRYFVSALDAAENHAKLPYMGAADPHSFIVGEQIFTDLTITPDTLIFMYEPVEQFRIMNNTPSSVIIESISSEYLVGFPTLPVLPYSIPSGDSLIVDVEVSIITLNPAFVWMYDSIFITSDISTQKVIAKVNSDLIGGIQPNNGQGALNVQPNPFKNEVSFNLESIKNQNITLSIFDIYGKLIRTLNDTRKVQSSTILTWDGKSNQGITQPEGIYFYQIQTGNKLLSGKIIKLK
jgi:hypothetical protein